MRHLRGGSATRVVLLLTATALLGASLAVSGAVTGRLAPLTEAAAAPTDGSGYTPLGQPCRVVDTRGQAAGRIAGATAPNAFGSRSFQIAGSNITGQGGATGGCGIPDGVGAVEISVTVTGATSTGFLRVAPNTGATPNATFINYLAGVGITNTGTVTLSDAQLQDLTVFNFASGPTHVIIDVQGFYSPASTLGYTPLSQPCRAVDTRGQAAGLIAGATAPNPFGTRSFRIRGTGITDQGGAPGGCGIPTTASAVEVSVTVTGATADGFLRVAPNTGSAPNATFINFQAGVGITNTGTVTLSGLVEDLAVFNFAPGGAHVIVDVQGFHDATSTLGYTPLSQPCRAVDTRGQAAGRIAGATAPNPFGDRSFRIRGTGITDQGGAPGGCGVPTTATAVEVSVTVTGARSSGFLRIAPGTGVVPNATFINFRADVGITNTGTVTLDGLLQDLAVFNFSAGATHVIVDVQGYWRSATADPPTVSNVSPASGPTAGGTSLTITGTNLTGASAVTVGGTAATSVVVDSATQITATTPAGAVGTVDVVVTTPAGSSATGAGATFTYVAPALTDATQITAGGFHSCARLSTGQARCWGFNGFGGLGDGTENSSSTPVVVGGSTPLTGITELAAGERFTCALLTSGQVRCWGDNALGQLGDGTTTTSTTPRVVGGGTPLTGAVQITAGRLHACALLTTGTVKCWGFNLNGQLGDTTQSTRTTPVFVSGLSLVAQVAAGEIHTCARLIGGEARCWGANNAGELGDTTSTERYAPVTVGGATPLTGITDIGAGGRGSCALLTSGGARCWGDNGSGELGTGTEGGFELSPAVVGGGTPLTGISLSPTPGPFHTCALLTSGQARCWGGNSEGELGNGTTTKSLTPTTVGGGSPLTGLVQVVVSGPSVVGNHSCGLLGTGGVRCWGDNAEGQLGDGTTTDRNLPVTVLAG